MTTENDGHVVVLDHGQAKALNTILEQVEVRGPKGKVAWPLNSIRAKLSTALKEAEER